MCYIIDEVQHYIVSQTRLTSSILTLDTIKYTHYSEKAYNFNKSVAEIECLSAKKPRRILSLKKKRSSSGCFFLKSPEDI